MKGHDLKESLIKDAADMQRQRGLLPNTKADEAEWTEQLRVFERTTSEAKPVIAKPKERQRPEGRKGAAELIADRGGELMTPEQVAAIERQRARQRRRLSRKEQIEKVLLMRRLQLLASKPDWRAKIMAAWENGRKFAIANPGTDAGTASGSFVLAVLEESSAYFGAWNKIPDRRILVGAK